MNYLSFFIRSAVVALVILGLVACGGSSGGSSNDFIGSSSDINVALQANGGSATASYDNDNAGLVNDGDTTTSTFWAGNVINDAVTIDFGSSKNISSITIYTNSTTFSSSNPDQLIEISSNGTNWRTTAQLVGGDVPCSSSSLGSGKVACTLTSRADARFIRFRVTATADIGLIQVHEIEVQGR